jgi:AcrR family transcriptional regulator
MPVMEGLRQRKKQRTRRTIAESAIRLFAERGYEETTIADVAAAVEIAPRTFFSYFPAKEDVLFTDIDDRIAALSGLELRRPGEQLRDALRRVAGQVVELLRLNLGEEEAAIRWRIIQSRPSLQATVLLRVRAAEETLATRLRAAYPDELDAVAAAAVVGAFTSGLRAAHDASPGPGTPGSEAQQAVDRVLHLLEHGLGGQEQGRRRR